MMTVMSDFDLARARAETPGCERVIHFNNAGCSLPPRSVIEVQREWLETEAATGGYELAAARADVIEAVYRNIAGLIGAESDEIAITENATFAWHQAFWSLDLGPGDRILTCEVEYATNFISYLQARERWGIEVEVVPSDASGEIAVDLLDEMIDERVKVVSITHIPTNGGLIQPAEAVGEVCRRRGVTFLLDACQTVGQVAIDVDRIGCDLLATTGRKYLRGPRGSGFLYVRRSMLEWMEPAFLDLHGAAWEAPDRYTIRNDARRFESWEFSNVARIGLGEAARYAGTWGMEAIEGRVRRLGRRLRAGMEEVSGVVVKDLGRNPGGIVSFTLDATEASHVKRALAEKGINVSVSQPSSTRIDAARRGLGDVVRASVHYYNTDEEIDRLLAAVADVSRR